MCLAGFHAPVETYVKQFERVTGRKAVYEAADKAETEEFTQVGDWGLGR